MPKLIRFLPWWLVIFALLLALVWIYRVSIIGFVGEQIISDERIDNIDYELGDISFSNAHLTDLSFEIINQGDTYRINSEDIAASYSIEALRNGIVDKLVIDRLHLEQTNSSQSENQTKDISTGIDAMIALLASALGTTMPFKHLEIHHLTLGSDDSTVFDPYDFAVFMDTHDQNAHLLISYDHATLIIDKFAQQLTAKLLTPDSKQFFTTYLKLSNNNTAQAVSFSGEIVADLGAAQNWLKTFTPVSMDAISGQVTTQLSGTKANSHNPDEWNITLSGTAENVAMKRFKLSKTDFALALSTPDDLNSDNAIMTLNDGSQIQFSTLTANELVITSATLYPVGTFGIKDKSMFISLERSTKAQISELSTSELALKQADLSISLDFAPAIDQLTFELKNNTTLNAEHFSFAELSIIKPELSLNSTSRIIYKSDAANSHWSLAGGDWIFRNLDTAVNDTQIHMDNLNFTTSEVTSEKVHLWFDGKQPAVIVPGRSQNFRKINGTLIMENNHVAINGGIKLIDIPTQFNYRTNINLNNKSGKYRIRQQKPFDISGHVDALNNLSSKWQPELSLNTGSLNFDIDGGWNHKYQLKHVIELDLSDVGGTYAGITFSGLSANGPITVPPSNRSDSANINVRHLEYGTEVENVNMRFRLTKFDTGPLTGVTVDRLNGQILGSKIESKTFKYDPNLDTTHLELSVDGLDIDQVMSMQQFEGLTVSGKLGGKLPIDITTDGIHIENGELWSQHDGGTINYSIDPNQAKALSNPLTDAVLKALEEFHYNVMTATVNYTPDGELLINFHIEGKSPKLESNRPIHLNINSEQNVLSLLESLKYTNDLNQQLNDKINKKFLQ